MRKFFFTNVFILFLFVTGSITTLYVFPERTQNFLMETLDLKSFFNTKLKNFIAKKINDKDINVNIDTIKFLKPDWTNVAKIELNNINLTSLRQENKSKIKRIELGFSIAKLIKNFLSNDNTIQLSYINFHDLTLNATIEKKKFLPGPLVKIFSSINQNNFDTQPYLKKILQSKIEIGKVDFLLMDSRNLQNKKVLEIKCENVLISEYILKTRSLQMECKKRKNELLLLKGDIAENFNTFNGVVKNIDPNLLLNDFFDENLNFFKIDNNSQLNGRYNIKTDKNFVIQSVNFISDESILISNNDENVEILKTKLNGLFSWEKKNNLLQYSDVLLGDKLVAFGEFDLTTKKGTTDLSIKKILVDDTKTHLNKFIGFDYFDFKSSFITNLNKFRGGSLRDLSFNIKFSLFKKFILEEITGLSNFSNIRFEYNNKIFKKILSTISGNFKFRLNPQKFGEQSINFNLSASDGFILFDNSNFQYKFNQAKIIGISDDYNFLISKADFFNNKNLEYSFNNLKIKQNDFVISKVEHFQDNKLKYTFTDTKIRNSIITKSFLKINNNTKLSNFIDRKFKIGLTGDSHFDVFLTGNIEKLNFNLMLKSNLKNSYLNIDYLDIVKKRNVKSFIKSEISIFEGKIISLKDTYLNIENETYKIGIVEFGKKKVNEVLLQNIQTPSLNLDKLTFSKNENKINILVSGKKIDLSNFYKKLQSKTKKNNHINLDITADLIRLNSKISLTGNLNGIIKNSSFKSIAYGKISLGDSPILDNGKFDIYVDNKISSLKGLGLVGGAETKIILKKSINSFPTMVFNTSNGGKLLNALGFTKNIKSGEMDLDIDFLDNNYNHYKGQIKSKKFSVVNTPGIINSLSVLSFSGIKSIISGEGVYFEKGEANIYVTNKIFKFDKLYLSSDSLGIAAKGKLNLEKKSIDLKGSVAPIKLISRIISVVPAIGELLTGLKKEGLFAGQFRMVGQIQNPEIQLNTLSFAPGILRDLFSKDWLDKNNFFVNGGKN